MILDPNKTCALVVAIEKYEVGLQWNLPGAAAGAAQFVHWLRRQGIKAKDIRLLCTPLDRNDFIKRLQGSGVRAKGKGSRRAIREVFQQVAKDSQRDTLFLYWAGHGSSMLAKGRILFYEDATQENQDYLPLDNVINHLVYGKRNFARQFAFIDACASRTWEPEHLRESKIFPDAGECVVTEGIDRQFYFAAGVGQEAAFPKAGEPGVFTLLALKTLGSRFDPVKLRQKLKMTFADAGYTSLAMLECRIDNESNWSRLAGVQLDTARKTYELEREALEIARIVAMPDAHWNAAARLLYIQLKPTDTTKEQVIHTLSKAGKKAPLYLAALLLRLHSLVGEENTRKSIYERLLSSSFGVHLHEAEQLVYRIFEFADPCYSIVTEPTDEGNLVVKSVWFFTKKGSYGSRVTTESYSGTLENSFDLITNHMSSHGGLIQSTKILIELIGPLDMIIAPPGCVGKIEKDFPIVFRWRDRTEHRGDLAQVWNFLREYAQTIRARTATDGVIAAWLNADYPAEDIRSHLEAEAETPLDFLAFRSGGLSESEQKEKWEQLLRSGVPFAAFLRTSAGVHKRKSEGELKDSIEGAKAFADIPRLIRRAAMRRRNCLLAHLGLIWDEYDRDPFQVYQGLQ